MVQEIADEKAETDYKYKPKTKEVAYVSELDVRKILGCYLISPGDKGDDVDLLEVFIA